jgi:hypothetical protein
VKQAIADLGLDRLRVHQTTIGTTIVACEVDKGTGLIALRDWVLGPDAETIAVGDSDADLAMFKAATRSFAPANIGCTSAARVLGCEVVSEPYQRGLLQMRSGLLARRSRRSSIRRKARTTNCWPKSLPPPTCRSASGSGLRSAAAIHYQFLLR